MEKRAIDDKVAELENELKDMVARGRKMFIKDQYSIKKELTKRFASKDFFWINKILLEEEDDEEEEIEDVGERSTTLPTKLLPRIL